MIEEKTRSKTYRNRDIGVCAKSIKSPIVLLQRLHIEANGAILAKDPLTDKLNISGKINKEDAVRATATTIKKSESKKSSNTIFSNLENEESTLPSTNPIETMTVLQSTLTESNHGVGLSTAKSYKFKKKLKPFRKLQFNKSLKTRSRNKSNHENSVTADNKLCEKIKKDPKRLTDKTTMQTMKISNAVATRRKISRKIETDNDKGCTGNSNFEKDDLISDSVQEHDVLPTEKVCSNSDILNDISRTEETIQIKTSISTRSGLLRKTVVNFQNSFQNISTTIASNNTPLPHEHTSNRVDNNAKTKISTRNKSREIVKASNASITDVCPVKISNEYANTDTNEKILPVNEKTDAIVNNDSSNSIKTRSTVYEAKADGSEKPSVPKSTPKRMNNRSSLNKIVLDNEMKGSNSAITLNNSNIKAPISTTSKFSDVKKTNDYEKLLVADETTQSKQKDPNLSEIQENSKSLSVGKIQDNMKLTLDTTIAKETTGRSTRNKSLKKKKIDNKLKTRQSAIANKSANLLQNSSTSKPSQTSHEEIIEKSKVDTDALTIKQNKIVKNKITTRSKLLEKKKPDGENDIDGNKVIQAEKNSVPCSTEIQFDKESSTNGNVVDQSMSSVDLNKTGETKNEGKRISTRSKALDKKHTDDSEKNIIDNNLLQSEKVQPVLATAGKKTLPSRKSSDKLKVVNESLKTPDNDKKKIISTRSKSFQKAKIDDNKKLTLEKPSIDAITLQLNQNESVSAPTEVQINNKLSVSEKLLESSKQNSTKTPKKVDTISTISTRSKIEKKKLDNHEKCVENKTIRLDQNHSTSDSPEIKSSEQPLPNYAVKDSLKLLTDIPNTKENTLTRSKSHQKKKKTDHEKSDGKNQIAHTEKNQLASKQTEVQINSESLLINSPVGSQECLTDSTKATENMNVESTISTRSKKTLEKDKIDNHETGNIDNNSNSPKRTTNSTKTPKKIDLKSTFSTRSRLHKKTENSEGSIAKSEAVHVEKHHSALNSSLEQSSNESILDANNLQLLPRTAVVNVEDSDNTITTRSGLTKKRRTDAKPLSKKKKALVQNQRSPSQSPKEDESTAQQATNVNLENETNICNINKQLQVCFNKEIVIKLSRFDQDQPMDKYPAEKRIPKQKVLRGKRKGEHESTVEEILKAKKTKQVDSSDNNADLSLSTENQQLAVDNQVPLNTTENIDESVIESQSNADSNHKDNNITNSIENVSENIKATEKDICLDNIPNINTADNTNCIAESPEILEKENQCDNVRVENEKEIIVNSLDDNNKVHEEETFEDRGEGISVDTSDNETNVEINVNNDDVIVEDNTPTNVIQDEERHSLLARRMVEEVISDWVDDDKTDNIDNTGATEDFSVPEVIQIDDNDDLDVIVDVHQAAVSIEKEKDPSHNLIPTSCENAEPDTIDISDSPPIGTETRASDNKTADNKECNNMNKESRESNSTSDHTSEVSEAEDVDDSNFESVDETSCAEIFADENRNNQEDHLPQETITYYNSEDISMDIGAPANRNTLNDVVMNLKDACDKITADLSAVNTLYENNEESSNPNEPELLYISDDSNEMEEEAEEEEEEEGEIMILEPHVEIHETQSPSPVEEQRRMISNQLQQVMQQGSPSISVIKASELRDEILDPPVEYPIKQSGKQVVVYPQRQMLSTTLLPASIITAKQQRPSSALTEDSIIQCPKCRSDFVGKSRLRRHWLTCGDAMYLFCPFCTTKVKQRRSLVHHLNTQHQGQIDKAEVIKVVDHIVKQTREAAGVKLQQGSNFPPRDLLRTSPTIPVLELPAYIRIQCVVCNTVYDEVPATYKKICDNCSSDLMTAICQLCRKQYMLSTKVAVHVQGNCIFNGRIKCRDCDFVSSSRYNLQEHIIRKHIYIAPEDYFLCQLGCDKAFRTQDALKKHERICNKEANLDCRFCGYKTKHRSAMKMHLQQHIVHEKLSIDNDGNVQVFGQQGLDRSGTEDDDRDLTTEQQVRSVIRVHCSRCIRTIRLTSNRSSCEFCKLSFTFSCSRCPDSMRLDSLHAARLHVIRNHSVKIHECPHCTERFSYVYDLTKHASKCKAKVFKCEQCNFRASQQNKIRQHKRRVHITDTNEPPFCKKCGKWFNRGDSLRRHEKQHCGVEPKLSCEHCKFKTKTKFSLLRHIQSQHAYIYENFSFVCDRCDKFYTNMFAYEDHVKNCHALYKN